MRYLMGIDGGGTGCRAALTDSAGRALGRGTAGPANIVTDPAGARANILAAAGMAAAGAGCALGEISVILGLAGANLPEAAERIAAGLPFARAEVVSDAVTALTGALGGADGVIAALGTGSVFVEQSGGRITQVGGWGFVLADEASGAWLGRMLLTRALRAWDGLAEMTPLLSRVLAEGGGATGVVSFAHAAVPGDFAAFAPRLFEVEDPAADEILAEADIWIQRSIDRLSRGSETRLSFVGGLGPRFAARLAPRYGARLTPPQGSALDGAVLLARRRFGAPPAAGEAS